MARIRTIKPEFFTDAKITSMTPLARLFYVSLWCEADREGRLAWEPLTLKQRYLPADKCDVERLANALTQRGLIRLYKIDGKILCWIPAFTKNQVINNREIQSSLPAYSDDACVTRESGDTDAAYGKEGRKGREGKEGTSPVVPKGDEYSEDFEKFWEVYPSRGDARNPKPPAWKAWLRALERGGRPEQIIEAAKAYAKTEAAGTKFCAQSSTWLNGDDWKNTPLPSQIVRLETDEDRWRFRTENWAKSPKAPDDRWWHPDWGAPPHRPNTKVPKKILEECGLFGTTVLRPREDQTILDAG